MTRNGQISFDMLKFLKEIEGVEKVTRPMKNKFITYLRLMGNEDLTEFKCFDVMKDQLNFKDWFKLSDMTSFESDNFNINNYSYFNVDLANMVDNNFLNKNISVPNLLILLKPGLEMLDIFTLYLYMKIDNLKMALNKYDIGINTKQLVEFIELFDNDTLIQDCFINIYLNRIKTAYRVSDYETVTNHRLIERISNYKLDIDRSRYSMFHHLILSRIDVMVYLLRNKHNKDIFDEVMTTQSGGFNVGVVKEKIRNEYVNYTNENFTEEDIKNFNHMMDLIINLKG